MTGVLNTVPRYLIGVSAACIFTWPEDVPAEFKFKVDDFDVLLRFQPSRPSNGQRHKEKDALDWTSALYEFELVLSRNEQTSPPPVVVTSEGTHDLTAQGKSLRERLLAYGSVAHKVSNRVLKFFQYSLNAPLMRPVSRSDHSIFNPTWHDDSGLELRGSPQTAIYESVPGIYGELGARSLTPSAVPDLVEFVQNPQEPSLIQTLLSNAQTALTEGELRRTVLELAICAEVMVKRKFSAKSTPAGAAFDYLEDKAKVSVRVLDLLDVVAEEAFSRSYRKEEVTRFRCIDELFRCRNKIAHRGELSFRGDDGATVAVDRSKVETWWLAVAHLKLWLESVS
jgi:hypothetical protein